MQYRINNLKKIMEQDNLDGILISSRPNTFYFTGFTGTVSMCLFTYEKAYLIADFRYFIQAKGQVFSDIEVIQYEKDFQDTLKRLLMQHNVKNLGLEGKDITYAMHKSFNDSFTGVKNFSDIQEKINRLRMIKDNDELNKIKKAVEIAEKAFVDVLPFIKPGVIEYEIALELEYKMKKLGAKGASFDIIVASGPRSALPHGVADIREFQYGDAVVMDFGAVYNGYCSDMTRTFFIGTPAKELKEIYDIVLKAQMEAVIKASTKITGKDLDGISRNIISDAGYDKYFGHGLGHGVGVEIHEMPVISPKGKEQLKAGMVFTVEPGIYVEGLGGVRIEDMVCLAESGAEILTKSSKELIIL